MLEITRPRGVENARTRIISGGEWRPYTKLGGYAGHYKEKPVRQDGRIIWDVYGVSPSGEVYYLVVEKNVDSSGSGKLLIPPIFIGRGEIVKKGDGEDPYYELKVLLN